MTLTFIGAALLAAFISPCIYGWVQELGIGIFPWLRGIPFSRVFSRVLLICVFLSMIPLFIAFRISNLGELGLQKNLHWKSDLMVGLLLALLPVSLLMTGYVYFDVSGIRSQSIEFFSFIRVLATAFGVSIIEEVLFRGLLYGLSRRVYGAFFSAGWTSALFAIVHFIRASGPSPHALDMWSGFREFGRFFGAIPPFPIFAWALATLFLISLLLCWTVERTHSLAFPIGLHMGWILAIQTFNLFTKFQIQPLSTLPWVAPHVVSGSVPVGIFAILSIVGTFLLCEKYLYGRSLKNVFAKCRGSSLSSAL